MKEIYKDIPSYKGLYQASNLGNIKSLVRKKERILKPHMSGGGYLFVMLTKNKKPKPRYVHKLVAEAHINHKPDGYNEVINHVNFNKLDNRAINLEKTTQRKNTNKKHLNSTSKYVGVYYYKTNCKWKTDITINTKKVFLGCFDEEIDAANFYKAAVLLLDKYQNNTQFRNLIKRYGY